MDIPKYKLKPEMLQLLPNIEYTNTDTKRLCGQEVSKRISKRFQKLEFLKNILERLFRKWFFLRFNLVKFLIGNVERMFFETFFEINIFEAIGRAYWITVRLSYTRWDLEF